MYDHRNHIILLEIEKINTSRNILKTRDFLKKNNNFLVKHK